MVDEMTHRTLYDIWYRMRPGHNEIVETGLTEEQKDRLMRAIMAGGGSGTCVWSCDTLKEPEVRLPIGKPDEIDPTSDDDTDERKQWMEKNTNWSHPKQGSEPVTYQVDHKMELRPVSVPVEPPGHVYLLMSPRNDGSGPIHRLFGPFRTTTEATDWGGRSKWGFGGDWSYRVIYLEPPEGVT